MSDINQNQDNEYKIFNVNCNSGCAFIDNSGVFAFAGEGVVSDYIKSKEFIAFEDFVEKCFIKFIDKNKLIFLEDNKTSYDFSLLEKIINFLIKVMGYKKSDIYVYFEFEKPLCLKVSDYNNCFVFIAPRITD
jgi:hypothetical protein